MPHLIALFIAAVIGVWAFYGFAAAAGRSPLLVRTALVAISAVLLLRAAFAFVPGVWAPEQSLAFIAITSAICAVMGFCFAAGTRLQWAKLSKRT